MKLTTNACVDMQNSMANLRHLGRLRGSAGSEDGWGTRRISSRVLCDAVHSRCSRNESADDGHGFCDGIVVPMSVAVPGGVAFFTSSFDKAKACLNVVIVLTIFQMKMDNLNTSEAKTLTQVDRMVLTTPQTKYPPDGTHSVTSHPSSSARAANELASGRC